MRVPDAPLDGAFTIIRSATQDDVDLLVAWHADPDVARYWDGETFTREEMLLRLTRPDVDPYVVMEIGEPVGYLQVWFDGDSPEDGGVDMFLIPPRGAVASGPTLHARLPTGSWTWEGCNDSRLTPTCRTSGLSRHGRRRGSSRSRSMGPMKSTPSPGC